jgi:peptidoglycan hydrolase CwlO-like protein
MLDFNFTITVPGAEEILQRLTSLEEIVMAAKDELDAIRQQIADSTANLAGDIEKLSAQVAGGMSAEDAVAVVAGFQEVADRLKAVSEIVPEAP